ncbi:MAG: hypothetical protein RJA07_1584 [Bacteroidota bacterium]|jgi:hypothetical protein
MSAIEIQKEVESLPIEMQKEVEHFIGYLKSKITSSQKPKDKMKMEWAGALKEFKNQYTSVELQHEILKDWQNLSK